MKRVLKGPTHEKFPPALRTFALTLHFYSPKAYEFVRNTFNSCLPHPRTLSKWYSSIDGKPGFITEALRAIKIKISGSPRKILVNLVLDEIHIMKKIEWNGKEVFGYINFGTKIDSDAIPEATQALVFMIVALNAHWKIPIAYFFIESLSGNEKANLVRECLKFLSGADIKVVSLTFDGAAANIAMMRSLGAKIDNLNSLDTYFLHPVSNEKIYLFLDICHMLKLVRNAFGSENTSFTDGEGKSVNWKYLENLVNFQDLEGLHAGNKLRLRHLQWTREKMKVKIAAQTLSRSVADALNYLEFDLNLPEFLGSQATANFILLFNNLFDIFNSKNFFAKYSYKQPLSEKNYIEILNYFQYAENYILKLQINSELAVRSGKKTGFLGFLIGIKSLKNLFEDYVLERKHDLSFICTYKLSQDHLEIFFSAIRSRCGSNNNPTCQKFESCFKKLLIHTEVKGSNIGNSIALDGTSILDCSSSITKNTEGDDLEISEEYVTYRNELRDHDYLSTANYHLSNYAVDVIGYMAGFVIRSIVKKISCRKCCLVLREENIIHSNLQIWKSYGKLQKASKFVISLCKLAEQNLRILDISSKINYVMNTKNIKTKLINTCLRYLPLNIYDLFGDHRFDSEPLADHCLIISKLILEKYIDIRIYHEVSKIQNLDKRPRVRSWLTKSILFQNQ